MQETGLGKIGPHNPLGMNITGEEFVKSVFGFSSSSAAATGSGTQEQAGGSSSSNPKDVVEEEEKKENECCGAHVTCCG